MPVNTWSVYRWTLRLGALTGSILVDWWWYLLYFDVSHISSKDMIILLIISFPEQNEETSGIDKIQSRQTVLFNTSVLRMSVKHSYFCFPELTEICDRIIDFKMMPRYCTVGNIQTKQALGY